MSNRKAKDYRALVRCYDNGGSSFDRYTILPPRNAGPDYWHNRRPPDRFNGVWAAIGASESPFHPQGFGQHVAAMAGPHLGKRIAWDALPRDVQRFARQSFPDYCPKEATT